ncbi:MAG: ribosome recycling factor [Phycisphaerae bacterium]|nr:ribosome recycling factor [Phycisphaerae bacterium]
MESEEKMEKAIEHLKKEFRGLRTGRASTALVENLIVSYYGADTPMKQLANLSTPEPTMILIKPFDTSCIKDIDKAIQAANIGITPQSDGRMIRLNVPPLSGERRQQLATQLKHSAEAARVSVRNLRRDANKAIDAAQKAKAITEDERDNGKKEMDDITKKYIDLVDQVLKIKTDEVMEI